MTVCTLHGLYTSFTSELAGKNIRAIEGMLSLKNMDYALLKRKFLSDKIIVFNQHFYSLLLYKVMLYCLSLPIPTSFIVAPKLLAFSVIHL